MPAPSRSQRRRQPVRSPGAQPARTASVTRSVEPPDYSREYEDVRQDLRLIAIIGLVLLAGMIGASFVI